MTQKHAKARKSPPAPEGGGGNEDKHSKQCRSTDIKMNETAHWSCFLMLCETAYHTAKWITMHSGGALSCLVNHAKSE